MELHRNTMVLQFFWTFNSGNIVVRWDYSVVRFYDAEKTNRIFGPDFVPFYEGYFPL